VSTMTPTSDDDDGDDDDVSATRELPPGADPAIDWGLTSHLDEHGQPRIVERWLVVPPELAGLRLDHFLKAQIARLSRTKIQQIIDTQLTRADGGGAKASTTVFAGDRFVIRRPAPPEPPCPRTFGVLVDDPRLLVIDKPAGLPVHASAKFYFNTLTRVLGDPTRLPHVRMLAGPGGSQAITRVQLVEQRGRFALVRCTLVTGRQHQIRAHLAAVGYPIVGDKLYAHGDDAFIEFCDRGLTPALAARFILWRHALHASTVDVPHPAGGRAKAEAPLPPDIANLV